MYGVTTTRTSIDRPKKISLHRKNRPILEKWVKTGTKIPRRYLTIAVLLQITSRRFQSLGSDSTFLTPPFCGGETSEIMLKSDLDPTDPKSVGTPLEGSEGKIRKVVLGFSGLITVTESLSICSGLNPLVKRINIDGDPSIYVCMHFFCEKNQGSKRGVLGSQFDLTVLSQFFN